MENNGKKKTVCSECINIDGGCCVGVKFNVHISEASRFIEVEKNGGIPSNHTFKIDEDDKEQYVYDSDKDRCVHLDENNACSIYEDRPLICSLYPILWKKKNYFIDMICPLVHFIPLRDIAMWPDEPKNIEIMKYMDELDFDGRSRQYINLKTLHEMNDALILVKNKDLKV